MICVCVKLHNITNQACFLSFVQYWQNLYGKLMGEAHPHYQNENVSAFKHLQTGNYRWTTMSAWSTGPKGVLAGSSIGGSRRVRWEECMVSSSQSSQSNKSWPRTAMVSARSHQRKVQYAPPKVKRRIARVNIRTPVMHIAVRSPNMWALRYAAFTSYFPIKIGVLRCVPQRAWMSCHNWSRHNP